MINQEDRFNKALVKFIQNFNCLELNLGLCINYLHSYPDPASVSNDPESFYPQLMTMTCEQKISKLRHLLSIRNIEIKELDAWFESAALAREKRNRYLHGIWEYLPTRQEKPVGFRCPPWWREKYGDESKEEFSLDEFDAVAEKMKNVFIEFQNIRRKLNI